MRACVLCWARAPNAQLTGWLWRVRARQVKQGRTAAGYEKMVLRMNEWMTEQGYEPFAEVVEVSPKRYRLELLEDDGVPQKGLMGGKQGTRLLRKKIGLVRRRPPGVRIVVILKAYRTEQCT